MNTFSLLLLVSVAHAYVNVAPTFKASPSALQAQRRRGEFPYGSTGGVDGSTLVSGRRVDIDAPWGSSRPRPMDPEWNRSRASRNEKTFPWGSTGGNDGSTLVAKGRVDVDAPWGANNPQRPSPRYYRESIHQSIPSSGHAPGTTGGIAGSTLVAPGRIHPDSAYGGNYHRLHQAGTKQQEYMPPQLPATSRAPMPSVRRVAPQQQRQLEGSRRQ